MKKIFTLLSAALMSLTISAENYTCALAVELNGVPTENGTRTELSCTKGNDGKYEILLKDFKFGGQPVGDINIKDINAVEDEDGGIYLTYNGNIIVTTMPIDLPGILEGYISDGEIGVRLQLNASDIYVNVAAHSNKTQIYGADFENWHKAGEADEPNGWHTISSGTGLATLSPASTDISDEVRPGSTGTKSARIHSNSVFGISANGTITTGRMHVGAMDATDTKNHVFIAGPGGYDAHEEVDEEGRDPFVNTELKDGNGDPFYSTMQSHPTSISLWYKFMNGEKNDKPALVGTYLVGKGYFQDAPHKGQVFDNIVASAKSTLAATDEWKQITIPFDYEAYKENDAEPANILVTINTCNVPGGGSSSNSNPDVLYVDDVTLNYEPVITGMEIFEKPVAGFSADNKEYKIVLGDEIPTDEDIDIYCNAGEATTMTYYEASTKKLTVNVYNEELKLIGSYVFDADPTGISGVSAESNHAVTGRYTVSGQKADKNTRGLIITKYADGKVVKSFK